MVLPEATNGAVGVAKVALDGRFIMVNSQLCTLLGYSEEELTQMRVRDVTHPDDRPQSVNIVDRSLRHYEESVEVIKRYLHKDGTVVWALLRTTLKRDEDAQPTYFISYVEDVRGRMQQERLPRALAHRLQEFREQERQGVARELHEELGQVLSALKLELLWLQDQVPHHAEARAARLSTVVDEVLASVRRLSHGLRPAILDELGLEAAIDSLLKESCGPQGLRWKFSHPRLPLHLDLNSRVVLYRVCQEALANVLHHSQATAVEVTLRRVKQEISLKISDNGIGIVLDSLSNQTRGLLDIRDRIGLLGGKVTVKEHKPRGTVLAISLPLPQELKDDRRVPPFWE